MLNLSNLCIFEGRTTQNVQYSTINGSNNTQVDKAFFSISVPRALTSQQRQDIKGGNQNIKQNDFVQCSLIGGQVATLKQYFPAGTPIKVIGHYATWESTDATTGAKKYGHCFELESISFVSTPAQNNGQNNANQNTGNAGTQQQNVGNANTSQQQGGFNNGQQQGGFNNGQAQQQQGGFNNGQAQQQGQAQANQGGNFEMFGDFPF